MLLFTFAGHLQHVENSHRSLNKWIGFDRAGQQITLDGWGQLSGNFLDNETVEQDYDCTDQADTVQWVLQYNILFFAKGTPQTMTH
jgi:hypothetical protein